MGMKYWLLLALAFVTGSVVGHELPAASRAHAVAPPPEETEADLREAAGRFTQPLLACRTKRSQQPGFTALHGTLDATIRAFVSAGRATQVSVYLRDLETGDWTGIHADERFSPASLLKVPVMMAVLMLAQNQPDLLSVRLAYPLQAPDTSLTGVQTQVSKSIDELLQMMIADSDNDASAVLTRFVGEQRIADIYANLRLKLPRQAERDDAFTVRDYAGFFQLLYDATLLNHDMSEKALGYLAKCTFSVGLRAGVLEPIEIAHKFGLRGAGRDTVQLHDCGIVYAPGHPYLLCVMTRGLQPADATQIGTTVDGLASVIRDLSREVHTHMTASRPGP